MNPIVRLINSSLGKKYIMGITGAALYGFVIIHTLGNLQIFLPPEAINAYGKLLKASPEILWGFRFGLLGMGLLHVWAAVTLTLANKLARPVDYLDKKPLKATFASRTMALSGIIVAVFVVYHILHFTAHITHPEFAHYKTELDGQEVHDIYNMVVTGFQNRAVSGFYLLGVGLLCFHLSHGIQSLFQSLGLVTEGYRSWTTMLGKVTATAIFIGMAAVPLGVMGGVLKHTLGFHPPVVVKSASSCSISKKASACPAQQSECCSETKECDGTKDCPSMKDNSCPSTKTCPAK